MECDFVLQDCDGFQQGASEGGGTSRQQSLHLSRGIWVNMAYTVKKVIDFSVPSRDVTYQTPDKKRLVIFPSPAGMSLIKLPDNLSLQCI
jgi:hypothetical protein